MAGVVQSVRGGLKLRKDKQVYDDRLKLYEAKKTETQICTDALRKRFADLGEIRLEAIVAQGNRIKIGKERQWGEKGKPHVQRIRCKHRKSLW